jgi:phospholipase/carboxylesterase
LTEVKPVVGTAWLEKLKVFVAHGELDKSLPVHYAREAKQFLEDLPVQLTYKAYRIDHQINEAILNDLNRWLASSN